MEIVGGDQPDIFLHNHYFNFKKRFPVEGTVFLYSKNYLTVLHRRANTIM